MNIFIWIKEIVFTVAVVAEEKQVFSSGNVILLTIL